MLLNPLGDIQTPKFSKDSVGSIPVIAVEVQELLKVIDNVADNSSLDNIFGKPSSVHFH